MFPADDDAGDGARYIAVFLDADRTLQEQAATAAQDLLELISDRSHAGLTSDWDKHENAAADGDQGGAEIDVPYSPPRQDSDSVVICSMCGNSAVRDGAFCLNCGAWLDPHPPGERAHLSINRVEPAASEPDSSAPSAASPAPSAARLRRDARKRDAAGSLEDRLSKAFRKGVHPGRVAFEVPRQMALYETKVVRVAMTRSLHLDDELRRLLPELDVGDPVTLEKTAPLMEVVLTGASFDIEARSRTEQYVSDDAVTVWEYAVTAQRRGRRELVLVINMLLPVPGRPDLPQSTPSIVRYINVEVSAPERLGHFAQRNWKWLVTTGVAAAGVAVAVAVH